MADPAFCALTQARIPRLSWIPPAAAPILHPHVLVLPVMRDLSVKVPIPKKNTKQVPQFRAFREVHPAAPIQRVHVKLCVAVRWCRHKTVGLLCSSLRALEFCFIHASGHEISVTKISVLKAMRSEGVNSPRSNGASMSRRSSVPARYFSAFQR